MTRGAYSVLRMPRRMTTRFRWTATIVSFVTIGAVLLIGVGTALFIHLGTRVTGELWLRAAAEAQVPAHLRALHDDMHLIARTMVAHPSVAGARDRGELEDAIRGAWGTSAGNAWLVIVDKRGAGNIDCAQPIVAARGAADVIWCGDQAYVGATSAVPGGVLFYGKRLDDAFATQMKIFTDSEVALLDGAGRVMATSVRSSKGLNELPTPQGAGFHLVQGVLDEPYRGFGSPPFPEEGWIERGNTKVEWLVYAETMAAGQTRHGAPRVVLAAPARTLTSGAYSVALFMFLIALVVVACAFLVARRVVRSFTQPISAVADAAARLASGERDVSVEERGDEEVASLARSFNQMVLDLNASRAHSVQAEKMIAMGQLSAGIAHELNTPAQFVNDHVTFAHELATEIAAGDPRGADIAAALETALEGIRRMTKIVSAMKTFAHPSNGEAEPTSLRDVIESSAAMARGAWKYTARLDVEIEEGLPPVPVIRDELGQAFINLIVNAADAIEERRSRSQSAEQGHIAISARRNEDKVEVRVSDDGTGIAPAHMSRLFDAFFTTKAVGKGTGQGLPIVWATIVERHHGTIQVESTLGVGTTFIIHLPLHAARVDGDGDGDGEGEGDGEGGDARRAA